MNPILARRLSVVCKSGRKVDYTHVTYIKAAGNRLQIDGERDGKDLRVNATDVYEISDLHLAVIEFYKPVE
jgi:hypothetical protein